MLILLNGAFGVGKTSAARALRKRLPGSLIVDPEQVGFVLQRAARVLPLAGRGTDDFQDMPAWRRLTVLHARLARLIAGTVIMPMAFSNLEYLKEVRVGLRRFEPDVRTFCLTAPLAVVRERLRRRGVAPHDWAWRRAAEACTAHVDGAFGEPVATDGRTIDEVVDDLLTRLEVARHQGMTV